MTLLRFSVSQQQVTASALLGKDKNHEGVTFTANMQPKIEEGHYVEVRFRLTFYYLLMSFRQSTPHRTVNLIFSVVIVNNVLRILWHYVEVRFCLTKSVCKVLWQNLIPAQIRKLVIYMSNVMITDKLTDLCGN